MDRGRKADYMTNGGHRGKESSGKTKSDCAHLPAVAQEPDVESAPADTKITDSEIGQPVR